MKNKNSKFAFSLVELSITLLVTSILITGAISVSTTVLNNNKAAITKERLETIYKSINAFSATHKHLPCPALIQTAKTTPTYGDEAATPGTCTSALVSAGSGAANLVYGMVPIKALNLPIEMAEDGFGNKFDYIVDKRFTIASAGTAATGGFENTKGTDSVAGVIKIQGPAGTTITNDALFVVLSHGANGSKAWSAKGTTQNTAASPAADEDGNGNAATLNDPNSNYDNIFISLSTNTGFDDTLLYKTKTQLTTDSGMEFIKCSKDDGNVTYPNASYGTCESGTTTTSSNVAYGAASGFACPANCTGSTSRTCGKNGVWNTVNCNQIPPSLSCKHKLMESPGSPSGVYSLDPDGAGGVSPFNAYCDMTTDGGGWTLVLNYSHASVNGALNARTTSLPLLGATTLGTDESGTQYWGHASNSLLSKFTFTDLLFYGISGNGKTIHFKTKNVGLITRFKTGSSTYSGLSGSYASGGYELIPNPTHNAIVPAAASDSGNSSNMGNNAMTEFPIHATSGYGWGIYPTANRWEVDNSNHANTIHQIWINDFPPALTIPGLILRWDVSALAGPPANGSAITSIPDTATAALIGGTPTPDHAISSTGGFRPTYITNCIGSLPCARFVNANSTRLNTATSGIITGNTLTVFVVTRRTSYIQNTGYLSGQISGQLHDSTDNRTIFAFQENATTLISYRNTTSLSMTHPGTGVFYVAALVFDNATMKSYINSVNTGSIASTGPFQIDNFYVGSRYVSSAASHFYDGDIGEVLIYNRNLTPTEIIQTSNFLKNKWGIN